MRWRNPDKQFVLSTLTQTIIDCPPGVEKLATAFINSSAAGADELVEIPAVAAPFRSAITEPRSIEEEKSHTDISGFTFAPEISVPMQWHLYFRE